MPNFPNVTDNADDVLASQYNALANGALPISGWSVVTGTFTWASASTINISSGGASVYAVGDRLKWITATGSTQRYATVITVADTLLTIAVNTDHVLVNEAWTLPYYSHVASPVGFPSYFNYASAPVNLSGGTLLSRFSLTGKVVNVIFQYTLAGAGVGSGVSFSLPVASPVAFFGGAWLQDSGVNTYIGIAAAVTTTATIYYDSGVGTVSALSATVPWTWKNNDYIGCSFSYIIA